MSGNGAPEVDPILDAAAELFERRGYDGTSVDDIALRSGYGRSTVFRKYRSKAAVLRGIVDAFFTSFAKQVMANLPAGGFHAARAAAEPVSRQRVPSRRRNTRATASSIPGPLRGFGPPVGVVLAALDSYAARHGPLVRVALAAKDLPWSRAPGRRNETAWRELAERCFGLPGDPLACCMLLDALKHIAHDHGCCSPSTALALARTLADLGVLARGFRFGTRSPEGPR